MSKKKTKEESITARTIEWEKVLIADKDPELEELGSSWINAYKKDKSFLLICSKDFMKN